MNAISNRLPLVRIVWLICILIAMIVVTGCETLPTTDSQQANQPHTHAPRDLDTTY